MTLADDAPTRAATDEPSLWLNTRRVHHPVADASEPAINLLPAAGPVDWQLNYRRALVTVDLAIVLLSAFVAVWVRFSTDGRSVHGVSYSVLSLLLVPLWMGMLVAARGYEMRYLGTGAEEFKRVGAASLRLGAGTATVCYAFRLDVARGYIAVALPLGTVLLLLGRYAARRWLHHQRAYGRYQHRVLAIGGAENVSMLANEFARSAHAGFRVVGVCVPAPDTGQRLENGLPVLGSLTQVIDAVAASRADTVAVASGPGMSPTVLRHLSWQLEGTGVDLVVAPALTDVAGPRINIRPVAGLPLLHVDEPDLVGFRPRVKATVERVVATIAFFLILPVLGALALLIRLDSPGAPLFRQTRVGRGGREFTVYKLRTMRADAEALLDTLREQNEAADGLLFKMRADPRVTRIGAVLRKWSLDELPQLWNVVKGDMAIVGPRPPLPSEVAKYGPDVARRLLVRPGITGLWQVSGRSKLNWEDSVRLDLYYVENWSFALDLMIIWKTVFAVLLRDGAY
jgi:exopolysaccharide biosynthesis polyprenyl glycosylphosphotransferase